MRSNALLDQIFRPCRRCPYFWRWRAKGGGSFIRSLVWKCVFEAVIFTVAIILTCCTTWATRVSALCRVSLALSAGSTSHVPLSLHAQCCKPGGHNTLYVTSENYITILSKRNTDHQKTKEKKPCCKCTVFWRHIKGRAKDFWNIILMEVYIYIYNILLYCRMVYYPQDT